MSFPQRRPAPAPAPGGRGGRPEKTGLGHFQIGHAIIAGKIVREGPVKRYSKRGTPWTTATLLVNLYDSRQKKERDKPAFIRVVAFHEHAETLVDFEKHQQVHAAGRLMINAYEDRDGNVREGYELQASQISRDPFPKLEDLLKTEGAPARPYEDQGTAEPAGPAAAPEGAQPQRGAWQDEGGQPEPPAHIYDDIPF